MLKKNKYYYIMSPLIKNQKQKINTLNKLAVV